MENGTIDLSERSRVRYNGNHRKRLQFTTIHRKGRLLVTVTQKEAGDSGLSTAKKAIFTFGLIAGGYGLMKQLKANENRHESKAVVILGSGRSGTSVLARAVNIAGVDLGDTFIGTNETNPKGFFENNKIVRVHNKISRKLKRRPFPYRFDIRKTIKPLRDDLKQYMEDKFADKPLWGWKDPRTNDFLPMWKRILKELNAEGHYLIIVRNPIDVVASYKRAYNRDETWARLQWQFRTLTALRETKNEKRIIVEYEDLFNNSLSCIKRIMQTFGLPWSEDELSMKRKLDAFIDPNLQRSDSGTDVEAFRKREDVAPDVKELYLLCLEGARQPSTLQTKPFQAKVDLLYKEYLRKYGELSVLPPK
ncbi:MAG TPA: sulfotransferase [Bacillales bacterium]|nr:sulfotransferase [Bacillales bacterium]